MKKGTICPALTKENYKYHLSGDCEKYCICAITEKPCFGRIIIDDEDRSSQFFSRAHCDIKKGKLEKCPTYGLPAEEMEKIIRARHEKKLEKKLKNLK